MVSQVHQAQLTKKHWAVLWLLASWDFYIHWKPFSKIYEDRFLNPKTTCGLFQDFTHWYRRPQFSSWTWLLEGSKYFRVDYSHPFLILLYLPLWGRVQVKSSVSMTHLLVQCMGLKPALLWKRRKRRGWARGEDGTSPGQLTYTNQRDIP